MLFDGLPVGSIGDPCDVLSLAVGYHMATVASGLASMIMEEQWGQWVGL